jgi:hypothetical protein
MKCCVITRRVLKNKKVQVDMIDEIMARITPDEAAGRPRKMAKKRALSQSGSTEGDTGESHGNGMDIEQDENSNGVSNNSNSQGENVIFPFQLNQNNYFLRQNLILSPKNLCSGCLRLLLVNPKGFIGKWSLKQRQLPRRHLLMLTLGIKPTLGLAKRMSRLGRLNLALSQNSAWSQTAAMVMLSQRSRPRMNQTNWFPGFQPFFAGVIILIIIITQLEY